MSTQPPSIMDDILDTTVRRQAEQAKADKIMGQTYGPGMGYTWELAALKIAFGRDFGFPPAQSLKFIHVIGGVPSLEVSGRAFLLQTAGYDWKMVKHDGSECSYRFYKDNAGMETEDGKPLIVSFTLKQAEQAGYVENSRGKDGKKGNYDKTPMNMLYARMLANFHRFHAPRVAGNMMADPSEITIERVVEATIQSKSEDKVSELKQRLEEAKSEQVMIEEKVEVQA